MKPALRFVAKLTISALLLGWVLSKTDLASIGRAFSQCNLGLLLAAFSLHLVGFWISVVRWNILLQAQNVRIPFSDLLYSYLVASFFNAFLPTTIGGDAIRMLDTRAHTGGKTRSAAVIFVDRFTGFFAMVAMALVALPFAHDLLPPGFYISEMVWALAFLFVAFVVAILWPRKKASLENATLLARFHACLVSFADRKPQLGAAFLWGLLLQVNVVFHYYLLCWALGFRLPLLFLFIVIPLMKIFLLFPVSINGIGLRENAFAYFLQGKGVGVAASLALSWLDLGMTLVFALIGGVVYVGRRKKIPRG